MSPDLRIDTDGLHTFCQKWCVSELALFGSVLRDDFGPESDIDILVTFLPHFRPRFSDLETMEQELASFFGRSVDLVQRTAVERSENYLRREAILGHLRTLYRAA